MVKQAFCRLLTLPLTFGGQMNRSGGTSRSTSSRPPSFTFRELLVVQIHRSDIRITRQLPIALRIRRPSASAKLWHRSAVYGFN
ncbi:unnamed protein product [Somion occarium]|uniref:Secreted protein n=1 Tax=Somion occarium TaxID=3059160 RepID=A0ABP1DWJ2_9APHY